MPAARPHPRAAAVALVALLAAPVALGACTDEAADDGGTAVPSSSAASDPLAGLSTYDGVAAMAAALDAAGLPCVLEYEGLRDGGKELSLCTLQGEQATLSIWFEPDQLEEFLTADLGAGGATAVGANWTVDVTTPALAQQVAAALGGTVKS